MRGIGPITDLALARWMAKLATDADTPRDIKDDVIRTLRRTARKTNGRGNRVAMMALARIKLQRRATP